jgi:hypothetical protein
MEMTFNPKTLWAHKDDNIELDSTFRNITCESVSASYPAQQINFVAKSAASQTIPDATVTVVTNWSFTGFTNLKSSPAFNVTTGAFTAPIDGLYSFAASVAWEPNATGERTAGILVGTFPAVTGIIGVSGQQGILVSPQVAFQWINFSGQGALSAGDQVFLHVQQSSGGTLDIIDSCTFSGFYVGPLA